MVMPVLGLGVREGERQRVLGTMEGVEGQRQGAGSGSQRGVKERDTQMELC